MWSNRSSVLALAVFLDQLEAMSEVDKEAMMVMLNRWHNESRVGSRRSLREDMGNILAEQPIKYKTIIP